LEVLISVVVLGLAITALLGGMTTTVGTSSISRQQADAEALLTSAGEAVRDPNVNQWQCIPGPQGTPLPYTTVAPNGTVPTGWTAPSVTLDWYLANGTGAQQATCSPTTPTLQLLTITVASPNGQVTMSRTFVKGPSS
jgi:Tfp pilus assembly protein PilV